MIPRTSPNLAALAALLLLGCERPAATPDPAGSSGPTSTSAPTSTETPTSTPTSTETPAAAAAPSQAPTPPSVPPLDARLAAPVVSPPVEVVEALALVPGASTPLKPGEQCTIDPGATFRLVLKGTYHDARLSLLDGGDAMVAGAGAREVGATTTVTLQPAAPLKPGSSYRLRVDGATTRELRAADGSARAPAEFPVLAAGEPPPEPKAKPKRAKKRP